MQWNILNTSNFCIPLGTVKASGNTFKPITELLQPIEENVPIVKDKDIERIYDIYLSCPQSYQPDIIMIYGNNKEERVTLFLTKEDTQNNLINLQKRLDSWLESVDKQAALQALELARTFYERQAI